jgi:ATP-dependent DNA helicase RecG
MSESQYIEWKLTWRDEYLKWISGFANAQGGMLVIGKRDDGVVVGVTDAKRLLEEIPNKARDVLGILVAVNLRRKKGLEYLEIVVDAYPNPVSYKGQYFIRSGSTKQELKGAALDRFLLGRHGRHWDGVPVPRVAVASLDAKVLNWFRRQSLASQRLSIEVTKEPTKSLLDKLHLLEGAYLKRAAVLLFHPDPEIFVTGAFIKIGFFENNIDLRYQDEIHGDLFSQANQIIALLKAKYLKALISYDGLQRLETFPIPDAALREALLNAIVHKDYASGVPIQISVYQNKLMIWNPGQLPPEWTLAKLLAKHASLPFNPDIANAFFRTGMIESWGRGIERMMAACASAGLPAPTFEYEATGMWTIFHFAPEYVQLSAQLEMTTQEVDSTTQENDITTQEVDSTTQEIDSTTQEVDSTTQENIQARILALLSDEPTITRRELATKLAMTADGVKYHLQKLRLAGVIRHVGPTKAGVWEVLK